MDPQQELTEFLASTTRKQRYRLAGKTLRFKVYLFLEAIVASLFLVVAALAIADVGGTVAAAAGVFVALFALGHFLRVAAEKPWLVMAAAFEAAVVWAVYSFWLSNYFNIPHFGVLAVFVFAFRFWQRGEREVDLKALSAWLSFEESNRSGESAF